MLAGELINVTLSELFKQRLFADVIPEHIKVHERPVAVYQYISSNAVNTLDYGHTGTDAVRIQVDVYAGDFDAAIELSGGVVALLSQQKELPCLYLGRRNLSEPETRQSRISMDFSIWEQL